MWGAIEYIWLQGQGFPTVFLHFWPILGPSKSGAFASSALCHLSLSWSLLVQIPSPSHVPFNEELRQAAACYEEFPPPAPIRATGGCEELPLGVFHPPGAHKGRRTTSGRVSRCLKWVTSRKLWSFKTCNLHNFYWKWGFLVANLQLSPKVAPDYNFELVKPVTYRVLAELGGSMPEHAWAAAM